MARHVDIPGVRLYPPTGKWRAYLAINGKTKHLGYFDTQAEAAEERALAEQENPRPVKTRRVRSPRQGQAPRAQSQERRAAPAYREMAPKPVEDESDFDPNEPIGPENYERKFLYPQAWNQIVLSGWCERWLAAGDWWRFDQYGKVDVWDAEVDRVAALCGGLHHEDVNAIMGLGQRDALIANPARVAEFMAPSLAFKARLYKVEDLV